MLNQLRKRFILTLVTLVGLVILGSTLGSCINEYQAQMAKIDRALNAALNAPVQDNVGMPIKGDGDKEAADDEFSARFGTLTVVVNAANEVIGYDDTFIDVTADDILNIVGEALESGEPKGELTSKEMSFKIASLPNGRIIAFADHTEAWSAIKKSILFSVLMFLSSMAALFFLSLWLSSYMLKPVKKAWDQQQQFVADASHELKTPLTAILANNNILLAHSDSTVGEQKKWIENSQAEASHMKDLVNNMLFLAKSDGEETRILFSEVSLTDVVTDSSLQFEPVAFERGIMIDTNIQEGITFQGDTVQLRQLIQILLDNACKYANENGKVSVILSKSGGQIKLSVNNTGTPIPPEDLPHIFERFYRSDKSRTKQGGAGGYGLGLAIAQSIVQNHGGTINATSNDADGTTFTVTLKQKN